MMAKSILFIGEYEGQIMVRYWVKGTGREGFLPRKGIYCVVCNPPLSGDFHRPSVGLSTGKAALYVFVGDSRKVPKAVASFPWVLVGVLHRENGPAIESSGGRQEWYREGICHSGDGALG